MLVSATLVAASDNNATNGTGSGSGSGSGSADGSGCGCPPWDRIEFKERCDINLTWAELAEKTTAGELSFKTAALGTSAVLPRFQVWMCVWGHPCDLDGESFCFVYDEVDESFVPWGLNSELHLFDLSSKQGNVPDTTACAKDVRWAQKAITWVLADFGKNCEDGCKVRSQYTTIATPATPCALS